MRYLLASLFILAGLTSASAQQPPPFVPKASDTLEQNLVPLVEQNLELNIRAIPNLDPAFRESLTKAVRLDPRIVGGKPIDISKVPWQVALIRGNLAEPHRSQFCGGSVIAERWIITAAHCIVNNIVQEDPARVNVVTGTNFFIAGGSRWVVEKIVVHPDYDPNSQNNDVALLKTTQALPTSLLIGLVSSGFQPVSGASLMVSGWGSLKEGGRGSDELMGVGVPVVPNDVCNAADAYAGSITDVMLCAGFREGGLDSCQGDSGGPAAGMIDGTPKLVGIVSWGEGCARKLRYGVYSRVSLFVPWVTTSMASN